jgi:hypothetical protein
MSWPLKIRAEKKREFRRTSRLEKPQFPGILSLSEIWD